MTAIIITALLEKANTITLPIFGNGMLWPHTCRISWGNIRISLKSQARSLPSMKKADEAAKEDLSDDPDLDALQVLRRHDT